MTATALHHEVAGAGEHVLLLHPESSDSRFWNPQWTRFVDLYRAIRVDLRGFGRSPGEAAEDEHAGDVAAFLDEHDISDVAIVGASLGARVAVELALARPGEVRALVLLGNPHVHRPAEVRTPTMVVVGEGEDPLAKTEAAVLAAIIPGARYEEIEHTGPAPSVERPATFEALVTPFLDDALRLTPRDRE